MSEEFNMLNLRDKVGQRLMLAFEGTELTPELADWLMSCRAGGVILFGRNIVSIAQVTTLCRDIQELAAKNGLPPLMIAIDEEGGRVTRMPADGQDLIAPSQMAQAAAGLEGVRASVGVIARNLRRLGINLDFAPVADVNNNPANPVIGSRSYGSDPAKVAEMVAVAVSEFTAQGVGSCVKHFPGHGDTNVDSHLGLPIVNLSRQRLDEVELVPFRKAFAVDAPSVMTAHIVYPEIEPDITATMSHYFLVEVLRKELGYNGLVFSDALDMKAIFNRYPIPEATILTLKAGADVALPCSTMEHQKAAFEAMVLAAENGEIELEESLARILAFKEKFCQLPPSNPSAEQLAADATIIAEVAHKSITLVAARPEYKPDTNWQNPLIIDFSLPRASPVEEGSGPSAVLRDGLRAVWPDTQYVSLPANPASDNWAEVLELAKNADLVITLLRNARSTPAQAEALQKLIATNPNLIAVAARDPYDLTLAEGALAAYATYGDTPCSIRALVDVLTGRVVAKGQLPVSL